MSQAVNRGLISGESDLLVYDDAHKVRTSQSRGARLSLNYAATAKRIRSFRAATAARHAFISWPNSCPACGSFLSLCVSLASGTDWFCHT